MGGRSRLRPPNRVCAQSPGRWPKCALRGGFNESEDVLDVDHDAIRHDSWRAAWLGDGPAVGGHGHPTDPALHVKHRSATHAAQARLLDNVAIVRSVVYHRLLRVDHQSRLSV